MSDHIRDARLVWHYTVRSKLKEIQATMQLRPFVSKQHHPTAGERPLIWFSAASPWAPDLLKNWYVDRDGDGTPKRIPDGVSTYGCARLGYPRDLLLPFCLLPTLVGMAPATHSRIAASVKQYGQRIADPSCSTNNWYCGLRPISFFDLVVDYDHGTGEGWTRISRPDAQLAAGHRAHSQNLPEHLRLQ